MKLKYIMYDVDGTKIPVIFGDTISHADIGGRVRPTKWSHYKWAIAESAGFVQINQCDGKTVVSCFGESISLALQSNPEDTAIVQKYISS